MSATTTVAPPAHVLFRRTDERGRVGSLHAARQVRAIVLGTGVPISEAPTALIWRTACGAEISERATVETWTGDAAFAMLEQPGARHCARCRRVGDAVGS